MARVCIIEGDEPTREVVRYLLSDAGFEVIEASNGLKGKAILEAATDRLIVLMDHRLPVIDGCDLLEIVARDEDLRARHTFLMMAASPRHAVDDCGDAIDELDVPVMPKPFSIDDLVEAVQGAQQRLEPGSEPAPAGS
ncbi:MAG TPA: response regulator [Ktedonobacterales bacterium]